MADSESRLDRIERLLEKLLSEEIAFRAEQVRLYRELIVCAAILPAPADDEPYTPEQQAADAEPLAALVRGAATPHKDLMREFGLPCD